MPPYRREPTNRQVRERVIVHLKETPLFARVSVRLLADLVDRYDLQEVPPLPNQLGHLNPAILVVPEAPVMLFKPGVSIWPLPMVGPVPPHQLPIPLQLGAYIRNMGALDAIPPGDWATWRMQVYGREPARIFELPLPQFVHDLPRILINALDLSIASVVVS